VPFSLKETVLIKQKHFKKYIRNNPFSSYFLATYGREQVACVTTQRNSAYRHTFGTNPVSLATFYIHLKENLYITLILYDLSSTCESPITYVIVFMYLLNNMCLTILIAIQKPSTSCHRWLKLRYINYVAIIYFRKYFMIAFLFIHSRK